jgi:predicted metal-dependent phosphoesterase TrpH
MIDLHCHTAISDNSLTVREVIAEAARTGITHLAITDHDTTLGIPDACRYAGIHGITLIPGIEISAWDSGEQKKVHLLGLNIDPYNSDLIQFCAPILKTRHQACLGALDRIIGMGYDISPDRVLFFARHGTGVFKQHIMHALMEAGYTDAIYGDLYRTLFKDPDNPVVIPIEYLNVHEAIRRIIDAGGMAVLAHPVSFGNMDLLPDLVDTGLGGIEVYHPSHGTDAERVCLEAAEQYNLVTTGGSDFHGMYGNGSEILGSRSPGYEAVEQLLSQAHCSANR